MSAPYEGGCLCGALRYRLSQEPITLYACHCTDCQRQSGSAFNLSMLVPRPALEAIQGTFGRRSVPLSGERVWNGVYCATCFTRLWSEPEKFPQISTLRPGTLDDTSWLRPVAHIWTRSKQPWIEIPEDTLNYEKQPDDYLPMIRAFKQRPPPA
jgi:hypothetical protein